MGGLYIKEEDVSVILGDLTLISLGGDFGFSMAFQPLMIFFEMNTLELAEWAQCLCHLYGVLFLYLWLFSPMCYSSMLFFTLPVVFIVLQLFFFPANE